MQKFTYTIQDALGLHARPAGLLVKEAKKYESKIMVGRADKKAEARKLMAIMGMAMKCGEEVIVEIEGADEYVAYENMKAFFETNL